MRYPCNRCGKFVKDKFILGLVHICLENEYLSAYQLKQKEKCRQGLGMFHPDGIHKFMKKQTDYYE